MRKAKSASCDRVERASANTRTVLGCRALTVALVGVPSTTDISPTTENGRDTVAMSTPSRTTPSSPSSST